MSRTDRPMLINRTTLAVVLVLAPALEVLEQLLSPLTGGSTSQDLAAIAAHPTGFCVSVIIGIAATILYVPALVGLAAHCLSASPIAARVGAAIALVSMMGFMGIRAIQAVELQTVQLGLDTVDAARLIDSVTTNPIGLVLLAMFLGGSIAGMLSLGLACWRTGLPRPAVVLMIAFPVVDLLLPGHVATIASHVILLAGLGWIASALIRQPRTELAPIATPAQ